MAIQAPKMRYLFLEIFFLNDHCGTLIGRRNQISP